MINLLPNDSLSLFSRSVFTINGLLLDAGDTIAKPLGLSVAKWHVLGRANHKDRTVAEIARYIGVSRQSVQRIVNDLEKDGLVVFKPKTSDARTKLVILTNKGQNALRGLYAADKRWSAQLMQELEPSRLHQLSCELNDISKELAKYSKRTLDEA